MEEDGAVGAVGDVGGRGAESTERLFGMVFKVFSWCWDRQCGTGPGSS